jgi:hypothetical protein
MCTHTIPWYTTIHSANTGVHIQQTHIYIYRMCVSLERPERWWEEDMKDIYIYTMSLFSSLLFRVVTGQWRCACRVHHCCYISQDVLYMIYTYNIYIYMLSRLDIEAGPYDTRRSYIWKHIWDVTHLHPYIWLNISQLEKHTIYMDMNIHIYISYI